jgi:hypothetical protein
MTKTQKQAWEQTRIQGRDQFILREGLIRRGVPFGVLFALFQIIFTFFRPRSEPVLAIVAGWAFATVGFGAFMGVWEWQNRERDYQKPTDADDVA